MTMTPPDGDNGHSLFEIVAGLRTSFGDMAAEFRQRRIDRLAAKPIPHRRTNVGTVDSSGDAVGIVLGGPAQGRVWHVRRLVVGRMPNWSQSAGGTAEVYAAPLDAAAMAASRDLSMLVDEASGTTPALPSVAFYAEGQIVVLPNEKLTVVIVGGDHGAQYVATCQVMDYSEGLAPQVVEQ